MSFNPIGAHVDGTAISSATEIERPAGIAIGVAKVLIQALTQNIRYTLDGTTPTSTTGFQLLAGSAPIIIPIGSETTLTVIQESATADIQYQWGT